MSKQEVKNRMLANLLDVKDKKDIFDKMTVLQNEISVSFDTKVVAVASVNDDDLAACFAKAFADTYSLNGFSTLIIDANLYNQRLSSILENKSKEGLETSVEFKDGNKNREIISIDKNIDAWCLDNEIYPSIVYKEGTIQSLIKEKMDKYDHFVIIVPPLLHHKEILLLADVVQSIVLVTQKNVTTKKHIFETLQFLGENKLPLSKTVVLK